MVDPDPDVVAAAERGLGGFEFYVVSDDPRLADKELRQEIESYFGLHVAACSSAKL